MVEQSTNPFDKYLEIFSADPLEILKAIPAPSKGPFKPDWRSLRNYRAPKWLIDARFGIFIHWGVYSVPAFGSEWYPRNMYIPSAPEHSFHTKNFGLLTEFGYKDFIPMFTAENWDPDEWAKLFEKSGAKFVVLVAEHHDGFAMWDSSYTRWCAARAGPKRDVVKELREAVESRGLIFGVSYHRAEHWFFFEPGTRIESDVRDPRFYDLYGPAKPASLDPRAPPGPDNLYPDKEFLMDWLLRIVEVVEKYRPWLIYFDWWIANPAFEPYLKAFAAYYYNRCYRWGVEPVIVYKYSAFREGTAVPDIERGTVKDIQRQPWVSDTSIDYKSWGYIRDAEYKPVEVILQHMVDVVSKNGVFLLNIGPKPDGTVPEEVKRALLEVGSWMKTQGEAVYGSQPWKVFGEGPTRLAEEGFFTEKKLVFTEEDVRYTVKKAYPLGEVLYSIVLGKPRERLILRALSKRVSMIDGEVLHVEVMGSKGKAEWTHTDEGLEVRISPQEVERYPYTIRILVKKG